MSKQAVVKAKTDILIEELSTEIMKHRILYYNEQPQITDKEYDLLCDRLAELDPEHTALTAIGAPISETSEWKKAKHLTPLGSLNKVNTPDELQSWYNKHFASDNSIFWVEKMDGFSIGLQYEDGLFRHAITRAGGGFEGEDISVNVMKMRGRVMKMQKPFTGTIRGEIFMRKSIFNKHFADAGYSNARNAASGIARRYDGVGCEHLEIFVYQALGNEQLFSEHFQMQFLKEQGFSTPNYGSHSGSDKVKFITNTMHQYQNGKRDSLDYSIDGLVIRINELEIQKSLGEKHLRPVGAVAFKFEAERAVSKVIQIDDQVGSIGRITPVAIIEPVELAGVMVSRATLHNYGNIKRLGLNIGDEVIVSRRNDVIPYIEEAIHSDSSSVRTEYKQPEQCPSCGTDTVVDGEFLTCPNTSECQAQIVGRLKKWIKGNKIDEFGDKLLTQLVEKGMVKTVYDLYQLDEEEVAKLDRMGEKSAKKCIENLWAKDKLTITLDNFLGCLSIPLAGRSTFKLLIDEGMDTYEKIKNAPLVKIQNIKGIGPERGPAIVAGLKANEAMIERLLDCVSVKETRKKEAMKDSKLNRTHICITGKTNIKRETLAEMILEAGGFFDKAVGKTTNLLVVADPSKTSIKIKKASDNGVKVISEDDLLGMIGYTADNSVEE